MYGLTAWLDLYIITRKERAIDEEVEQLLDAEWDRALEDLLSRSS
jgi:hypothetical protein